MILNAKWIKPSVDLGEVCPVFSVSFTCEKKVQKAILSMTAMGVYEAEMNGQRVGDFILAPGWTVYEKRLQVQQYDVTKMLKLGVVSESTVTNHLEVTVGKGWYRGRMPGWVSPERKAMLDSIETGLTAQLELRYEDGSTQTIETDETWLVSEGKVRFSEIYDGEIYDASFEAPECYPVQVFEGPTETLIPQQGEEVREQERLVPANVFTTPTGETVFDFGQEITGYVELQVDAKEGETVSLSFAEVMDKEGNFYTANYRGAKAQYIYTCTEGKQTYKPKLTFYGFRYIRIDSFPGGIKNAKPENFTAIVVHSQMQRTGYLRSSNPLLNKLFDNIVWGQKGNFLDVPTDCPQRDERLGWTGDAQAFIRTACLNYDVEKFFIKWLADMSADQEENGRVGHVIPDILNNNTGSAAWDDAATICPWTLYLAYGNPDILRNQYDCMEKWVGYITNTTTTQYLWTGGTHYEDWLGLDAPSGSYKGSTRADFLATAFYAYSTELLIKAGKVLGKDMAEYEALYENIVKTFRETYPTYTTQTECVLAAHFRLAECPQAAADQLAEMVKECGHLKTGFVGTPYLLHVLSDYGYVELAYDLLLRTKYPSWLYPVTKGATTIWEHWDGIMENGDFWSADMNSYNHYAYGAVADWVYCQAAGINTVEAFPGYEKVKIAPLPDVRLDWLEATVDTRRGKVSSRWQKQDNQWRYEITTPVEAEIVIAGQVHQVGAGSYI
ncbi:MAG: family 78 glycoside hydrolase catalytic domain, partial [Lachnospiraceae bacterium]|nr:family 78 glycoside hydrolase catalytic domain [Lachnospiraceae bacterium]